MAKPNEVVRNSVEVDGLRVDDVCVQAHDRDFGAMPRMVVRIHGGELDHEQAKLLGRLLIAIGGG